MSRSYKHTPRCGERKGKYSKFLERFQVKDELHEFDNLSSNQISYYETWYKYALMADKKLNLYESGE